MCCSENSLDRLKLYVLFRKLGGQARFWNAIGAAPSFDGSRHLAGAGGLHTHPVGDRHGGGGKQS